jgi:hypothetical protein
VSSADEGKGGSVVHIFPGPRRLVAALNHTSDQAELIQQRLLLASGDALGTRKGVADRAAQALLVFPAALAEIIAASRLPVNPAVVAVR